MEAAEANGAFVFLNDAFADPETEAGALGGLGGEERLEEAYGVFAANAVAGVDDGDGDAATLCFAVGGFGDAQAESSARRHRLDGVADEVEEDLAQLARESAHDTGGRVFPLQVDVTGHDGALLEFDDIIEQIGDGDGDGLFGVAIEAERLARDMGGALE